ncbi:MULTISPECIES: glycoside hydrolase family 25 protein [Streptomyces]|uniref:Glycoside hydrolase family 25 protein n=1 Tax=Streptomyces doudnae TaxID=3075536 RepID=A0ABD5ELQ1_9ACTN|nr:MULTISPECIES: glycoside hydrolase family 25 protein [unclassified Streptomyces]MDT0434795.1 glycoside hydrolase family 25 protein [Streptomyces sp. DSM 41981]MYQ68849.1 muramidase [Streptomyces sp. SID4950]SCE49504.1 Glycosyl hydrolases family 25 [Streptomyces sp. SolWspMP-5a-2]
MLRGIDVSAFQSSYDTSGLSFVFIKATEGRSYVNPRLTTHTKAGRDAGLVVGFYHFLWPGNITAQAEYFVKNAPEKAGDILAVDWETTGDGTHASNAEKDSFIRQVKKLRPNNRVVLYCNRNFWLTVDTTSYAGDGLWIADYVTAGEPRIKADWRFHQYTEDPHDKDVADFADKAALREWASFD